MSDKSFIELVDSFEKIRSNKGIPSALAATGRFVLPEPYDTYPQMCEAEYTKNQAVPLPTWKRLNLIRRGFLSHLYFLYQFYTGVDRRRYVSTFDRIAYTGKINNEPDVLNLKDVFYDRMETLGYGGYVPNQYGMIKQGQYDSSNTALDELEAHGRVVIKKNNRREGRRRLHL